MQGRGQSSGLPTNGGWVPPMNLPPGTDVEVAKFPGRWYPAKVLEGPREDGAFKVNFPLFGETWDDWIEPERIRQPGPNDGGAPQQGSPDAGPGMLGAPPQRQLSGASVPQRQLSMRTSSQMSALPSGGARHPYDVDASRVDELAEELAAMRKMVADERRQRVSLSDQVGLCQRQLAEERETR